MKKKKPSRLTPRERAIRLVKSEIKKQYKANNPEKIVQRDEEKPSGMFCRLPYLREKASKLPLVPGVYFMRAVSKTVKDGKYTEDSEEKGEIIYVGKAKNLKNRVSSYFHNVYAHLPKTFKLVSQIYDFDFFVLPTELDALVFEASQIKLHNPKYNILLKDDKGFNYIFISDEPFSRISYEFQKTKKGEYIGPYTGGFSSRALIEEVNTVFKLPTCTRVFPRDFGKQRPCLNYSINKCMGVCKGNISENEYSDIINQAKEYIKTGAEAGISRLEKEMFEASDALDFEKAAKIRDRIQAISRIREKQQIVAGKKTDYDIVALAQSAKLASVAVIKERGGRVIDKQNIFLGDEYEHSEMVADFLLSYYGIFAYGENVPPREIYIDCTLENDENVENLEQFLSEKANRKVKIITPKRGEMLTAVNIAKANASEYLALKTGKTSKTISVLEELSKTLALTKIPVFIECFDISNLSGENNVAGMTVFKDGKPFKEGYRKFIVKTEFKGGQNDVASMAEVLTRRLHKIGNSGESDYFNTTPDVIFLDGGKGQLNAVLDAVKDIKVSEDIQFFGLVKDDKHRTRGVINRNGDETRLSLVKGIMPFLTEIQDETHRFSVSFMNQKHTKKSLGLELTNIKGIGNKKALALMTEFKNIKAIKYATPEELSAVLKLPVGRCEEIKKKLIKW